jgi:hypothetical protein
MSNNIINIINKLFPNIDNFNNFIFIYTPPKVGSTTIVSSLRISLGNEYSIIHIHDEIMLNVLTGINNVSINEIIDYLTNINKNVYVIDIYRTPIERKISEYFEKISPYHFNNSEENIINYNLDKIIKRFNNIFPYIENGDHYHEKYNISNPIQFNFQDKFTLQIINNIKYIKLRLMDSKIWDKILSKIFNKEIIIINDYLTENKKIGSLYNIFKKQYKIPINFFEKISNCKYLNFYLNTIEKKEYLNNWENKITDYYEPYSEEQFNFYINLCLENQYINDVQIQHYIDEGCICSLCKNYREYIYNNYKNGNYADVNIIHNDIIRKNNENKKKFFIKKINDINNISLSNNSIKSKFYKNQFKIKHF